MKTKITETGGASNRPWSVGPHSQDEYHISSPFGTIATVYDDEGADNHEANAALIVQAVNLFDLHEAVAKAAEEYLSARNKFDYWTVRNFSGGSPFTNEEVATSKTDRERFKAASESLRETLSALAAAKEGK